MFMYYGFSFCTIIEEEMFMFQVYYALSVSVNTVCLQKTTSVQKITSVHNRDPKSQGFNFTTKWTNWEGREV